jgi:2'-5' RNA ligase
VSRLFVAVRPPAEVLDAVEALARPEQHDEPGVRWVPREQWHVTVRFFGEADENQAAAALDEVGDRRPVGPIEATLGPQVSRLGRSVICLPAMGLEALATIVADATASVGEPPDPRPFHGHLTLGRMRHRGACRLTGQPLQARFPISEIELVRSTLGPAGARHEVIGRWPLAGGG